MFDKETEFKTDNAEQTERIGYMLADFLISSGEKKAFVAMYGGMGAGKTAFARGFVSRISPVAAVRSPTYTIVNEYRGGVVPVFHFDMYRIQDEDDLYSTGFWEYLDQDGFCLCEWSENIPYALPERYIKVEISRGSGSSDERKITASIIRPDSRGGAN